MAAFLHIDMCATSSEHKAQLAVTGPLLPQPICFHGKCETASVDGILSMYFAALLLYLLLFCNTHFAVILILALDSLLALCASLILLQLQALNLIYQSISFRHCSKNIFVQ